jgi:hypothetical protein
MARSLVMQKQRYGMDGSGYVAELVRSLGNLCHHARKPYFQTFQIMALSHPRPPMHQWTSIPPLLN